MGAEVGMYVRVPPGGHPTRVVGRGTHWDPCCHVEPCRRTDPRTCLVRHKQDPYSSWDWTYCRAHIPTAAHFQVVESRPVAVQRQPADASASASALHSARSSFSGSASVGAVAGGGTRSCPASAGIPLASAEPQPPPSPSLTAAPAAVAASASVTPGRQGPQGPHGHQGHQGVFRSTLVLVDLAGSECAARCVCG